MTPDKYIDLITPEADRQPRARRSALSSNAAVGTLSIDLTADTSPPVSARGIADDVNDHRGGDVRNDSYCPPDLPRLHETRESARLNSSRSCALAPVAPVTNSLSSPRKKKSRSSQRRFRGKENSSSDVSAFDSPPVENRKSPCLPPVVENRRKAPLFCFQNLPPGEVKHSPPRWLIWREKTPLSHYQCLAWILTHYQSLAWILSESLSRRERTHLGGPEIFPA